MFVERPLELQWPAVTIARPPLLNSIVKPDVQLFSPFSQAPPQYGWVSLDQSAVCSKNPYRNEIFEPPWES